MTNGQADRSHTDQWTPRQVDTQTDGFTDSRQVDTETRILFKTGRQKGSKAARMQRAGSKSTKLKYSRQAVKQAQKQAVVMQAFKT